MGLLLPDGERWPLPAQPARSHQPLSEAVRAVQRKLSARAPVAPVLEEFPGAAFLLDDNCRVVHLNRHASELLGGATGFDLDQAVVLKGTRQPPGRWPAQLSEDSVLRDIEVVVQHGTRFHADLYSIATSAGRCVLCEALPDDIPGDVSQLAPGALDTLPFAVIVYERNMRASLVNRYAMNALGLSSQQEFQGLKAYRPGSDEIFTDAELPMFQAFKSGLAAFAYDLELDTQGKRVPLVLWAKPYSFDATGKVATVIVVGLGGLGRSLMATVRRAQLELDASTRAKNAFVANLSHELSTPLTEVVGNLHLSLKADRTDSAGYVKSALCGLGKLQTMIHELLELTRLESAVVDVNRTTFPWAMLANTLQEKYTSRASARGINLTVTSSSSRENIYGDFEKIQYILDACVDNAVKFTDQGHVAVSLASDANGLAFSIEDTGRGIPKEQQVNLFKPFQLQTDYLTQAGRSMGLGLAISASYCRLMDGCITIASEPGRGARITVTIPAHTAKTAATRPGESPDNNDQQCHARVHGTAPLQVSIVVTNAIPKASTFVTKAALRGLDEDLRKQLATRIRCADPVGFLAALSGIDMAPGILKTCRELLDDYRYEDLLALIGPAPTP